MLTERFEVILETDDDLRQCVEAIGFEKSIDFVTAQVLQQPVDDGDRTMLIEQLERAARFLHQRQAKLDIFGAARVLDKFEDGILGFLDVVERGGDNRGENAVKLIVTRQVAFRSGLFGAYRLALLHLVERLFHL